MRLTAELIAETCHEANRVLQRHLGEEVNPSWDEADDELKESAIDGVKNALVGASPQGSHENWMKLKQKQGWTYGRKKDPVAKTHPCLVEYYALPEEQRFKDKLFVGIVKAFKEPL